MQPTKWPGKTLWIRGKGGSGKDKDKDKGKDKDTTTKPSTPSETTTKPSKPKDKDDTPSNELDPMGYSKRQPNNNKFNIFSVALNPFFRHHSFNGLAKSTNNPQLRGDAPSVIPNDVNYKIKCNELNCIMYVDSIEPTKISKITIDNAKDEECRQLSKDYDGYIDRMD